MYSLVIYCTQSLVYIQDDQPLTIVYICRIIYYLLDLQALNQLKHGKFQLLIFNRSLHSISVEEIRNSGLIIIILIACCTIVSSLLVCCFVLRCSEHAIRVVTVKSRRQVVSKVERRQLEQLLLGQSQLITSAFKIGQVSGDHIIFCKFLINLGSSPFGDIQLFHASRTIFINQFPEVP